MPNFKKTLKKYFRTPRPSKQQFYYYFFKDIKKIPKNAWLLDIAAAKCKGYDIFNNFKYVAADISLEALKHPYCFNPNINRVVTDILSPGFKKQSFDAVISTHTLSHLKINQRMGAISNIANLVKPGGVLIFTVQLMDKGEESIKIKAIKNALAQDFIIHRAVKYDGLLTRAYEKTVVNFFQRFKVSSPFIYRLRLVMAFFILGIEYITQLFRVYSKMAYFCVERKTDHNLIGNNAVSEHNGIVDKIACPNDFGTLNYVNSRTLSCEHCNTTYKVDRVDKYNIFCIMNSINNLNNMNNPDIFQDKTILVTGGTGSFGKKFVEIALRDHNPKAIRIFSRDELKQYEMEQRFNDPRLRFFIGNVRDKNRLDRAMKGVDIVLHAAALKQVPACEYNPFEAIKTNILGAQNVIEAAIDQGVKNLMLVSTDKAVNPVNLYGATKLCAEKLFVQGNAYASGRVTKISAVRYGNVVGSRGSVIPVFQKQKQNNILTITDTRMTRFWVTQSQAVKFVIMSLNRMQGGEIFVPKLPSMRITDLAQVIAPQAEIKNIGIRPGEKLAEVLLTTEEVKYTKEFDDCYIVEPKFSFWNHQDDLGRPLDENFIYASNNNTKWLSPEELEAMIQEL